ncbi:MAG TPA: efflux RND transporter periplasmic adaptor subunit, partial [Chitinophagaceae bacterium]
MKSITHRRIIAPVMVLLLLLGAGCGTQSVKDKRPVAVQQLYRCPMHHEIVRDRPGSCPICGMDLVAFNSKEGALTDVNLNTLLRPANSYVVSSIPVTVLHNEVDTMDVKALGTIQYDTRAVNTVSARVSGRIEKLYLKYTFQDVRKGQKLMDIYSPELVTAQQNLLFLLQNDAGNASFIQSAKEKLLLLGMSNEQLQQVIRLREAALSVTIYSPLDGHIHDALNMEAMMPASSQESLLTRELMLKEGMYVQKGQAVLTVMNPRRLWVV